MHSEIIDKYDSFYLIGIGGVSMSGIAKYLSANGKKVGGSDISANEYTEELSRAGVRIDFGNTAENIENYQVVIYTDAVHDGDMRLQRALSLSKVIFSRGEFLYEISKNFKCVIAVSGCHGKTTCTAMLTHVFAAAKKRFASHIGGKDSIYSNFYCCGHDYFITEACEYKKNFLHLKPDIAVILNSDADHLECYGSVEALKSAYLQFASCARRVVSLYKDLNVSGTSFGFDKCADYYASDMKSTGGAYAFSVYKRSEKLGRISLGVYGKHNILNALAAISTARSIGIDFDCIKEGIEHFAGVERRFEKLATADGVLYYADYAHHPNELSASLKTARRLTSGNLFVVFQPHTYSRTRLLFSQFVNTLSSVDNLMIYKTFAAREYFDDAGSALTLSQSLKKSDYGDCPKDLERFISKAKEGDVVLFLGAGDIYFIAKRILSNM